MRIGITGANTTASKVADICQGIPGVEVTSSDVQALIVTDTDREKVTEHAHQGTHVLLPELKIASVQEMEGIYSAFANNTSRVLVGNHLRFTPLYETLHRIVTTGELGQIGVTRIVTNRPISEAAEFGGDVMRSIAQEVDLLQWYFGPAKRVYAKSIGISRDYLQVVIRFESGVIGYVENSLRHTEFRREIEVAGSNGLIRQASDETISLHVETYGSESELGTIERSNPYEEDPDETQIRHFVNAIRTGDQFLIEEEDMRKSMEILDAIGLSLERGEVVALTAPDAN